MTEIEMLAVGKQILSNMLFSAKRMPPTPDHITGKSEISSYDQAHLLFSLRRHLNQPITGERVKKHGGTFSYGVNY